MRFALKKPRVMNISCVA